MLKGERGFLILLLAALTSAAVAWALMRPAIPNLPSSEFVQAEEGEYSPGSPFCYPSRLESLPDGESADERYRCETQADKHRLKGDDLVQQTRAANAAVATTVLTYNQAVWASLGTIFGILTLLAAAYAAWYARHAAEAAGKANAIALANQRAWVTLKAAPMLARTDGIDGLYLRIDILAQNCGASAATHFEMNTKVYFVGPSRPSREISLQMEEQIASWKKEYVAGPVSVLMPSDIEKDSIWDRYKGDEVDWTTLIGSQKAVHPMILAAVFYRTASNPETVQLSWRSWFLQSIDEDGHIQSWVPKPPFKGFGPSQLCVEPHRMNLTHEEYAAEDDSNGSEEGDDD